MAPLISSFSGVCQPATPPQLPYPQREAQPAFPRGRTVAKVNTEKGSEMSNGFRTESTHKVLLLRT